jgi:hypothetical protein
MKVFWSIALKSFEPIGDKKEGQLSIKERDTMHPLYQRRDNP